MELVPRFANSQTFDELMNRVEVRFTRWLDSVLRLS